MSNEFRAGKKLNQSDKRDLMKNEKEQLKMEKQPKSVKIQVLKMESNDDTLTEENKTRKQDIVIRFGQMFI